jgi:hypothetical protein
MDIAPTVVHMLDGEIPTESDGRVLLDIFSENTAVRLRDVKVREMGLSARTDSTYLNAEEQEQIERQLQDLGYLG